MEHELDVDKASRRDRLRQMKALRPSIVGGTVIGKAERQRRVSVDLTQREAAQRAIIYSEILGLPKSLRQGPDSWER